MRPPWHLKPWLPPALRAMASAREQRYASAEDFGQHLERWPADEPVSMYREPWPQRLVRAYNAEAPATSKPLTEGIPAGTWGKPKRVFGTVRQVENGGSLTILATALLTPFLAWMRSPLKS